MSIIRLNELFWESLGPMGDTIYQLIHQGNSFVPCDFIASVHSHNDWKSPRIAFVCCSNRSFDEWKTLAEAIEELKK